MKTIDDMIDDVVSETSKINSESESIYGFTQDELANIKSDRESGLISNEQVFYALLTRLFRNNRITEIWDLERSPEEKDHLKAMELKRQFYQLQAIVVQKKMKRQKKIPHKKGEFKYDESGNPILKPNGNNEEYLRDCVEYRDEEVSAPAYDTINSPNCEEYLNDIVKASLIYPDFDKMIEQTCAKIDFNRGLEIIRWLSNFYEFEDVDWFVKSFSHLICNAKSRSLGQNPKWGVIFSLVGSQGIGKGFLANALMKSHDDVFDTCSAESNYRVMLGRFNSVLTTRGFIHLDEKNGIDANSRETLKSIITEPRVTVEKKGKEPGPMKNMTTLFSTTNEPIFDVIGNQVDRRIVEIVILGRKCGSDGKVIEIDPNELNEKLKELWMVMPMDSPYGDEIIQILKKESSELLDSNMDSIFSDLWNYHKNEFINGTNIQIRKLREVIKTMCPGTRANDVVNWGDKHNLWKRYSTSKHLFIVEKNWLDIVERQNKINSTNPFDGDCDVKTQLEGK